MGTVRIEIDGMDISQLIFIEAVVLPELKAVLEKYSESLAELAENN